MSKVPMSAISSAIESLLRTDAKRATKFLSPKLVVSVQRVAYKNKIDRRDTRTTLVLKLGAPNYAERDFIKDCQKAKEKFPVKGVILKFFPEPKKGKK